MTRLLTKLLHPNVQAVACWLKLLNVKVHAHTIEEQMEQHPDWPSLLCISDALHQWKVPHLAAKATDHQLPDQQFPLLLVTNHPERPLAVVEKLHNDVVYFYQSNYTDLQHEPFHIFVQRWTGVYMIAEATSQSGDPEFAAAARKRRRQLAGPIAALLLALTALCGLCWPRFHHMAGPQNLSGGVAAVAVYILYLAGLAVSLMLLWYDIDKRNPLLQKVCTGLAKTNCNAILNSTASKLFGWLSWSEIGFAYFTGGLLLLALPAQAPWAIYWLGLLGATALVYPLFSIYYQWRVAKQWCMLCLAVQAILVLQAAALWMGGWVQLKFTDGSLFTPFFPLNLHLFLLLATAYILPLLAWLSLKPWLLRHQTALREQRAYRRLKFNPEVFTNLLQKQKAMASAPQGLGIVLGAAHAANTLVKVCNPYCGPCSKAHPRIEELLHRHANLQVQILFMVPNAPGDKLHTAASHLMAIARTATGQAQVQQALDDWYMPPKKDYEAFAAKYPMNGAVAVAAPAITAMEQWSKANDIRYTPTLFFNGHELPAEYDLEDLTYFLQE